MVSQICQFIPFGWRAKAERSRIEAEVFIATRNKLVVTKLLSKDKSMSVVVS